MPTDREELNNLTTNISISLISYGILLVIFPGSTFPIVILILMISSSLYKAKYLNYIYKKYFNKLEITNDRQDLINTIQSLSSYKYNTQNWNNRKKKIFFSMPIRHQKLSINYLKKFDKINKLIDVNSQFLNDIAKDSIDFYNVQKNELRLATFQNSNDNFNVIEALCHFQRDWSSLGDVEINPILNYVKKNLNNIVNNNNYRGKTCVIIPGSGLGRIAHELAAAYSSIHFETVEYSWLMHLSNQFIYKTNSDQQTYYNVHPFIHSYSNHTSLDNQTREIKIKRLDSKPSNLKLNHGDFRLFKLENSEDFDNIIIVSVFFLDTAENIFEYLDAMERLISSKHGYWINVGPLKYGSAPKVEFNLEEWREIRKKTGWIDIDEPKPYGKLLTGYLTDTRGLWQGQYGLCRWVSKL
ncbi:uncharacterized protein ASCRUDRAFT_74220 [Ascoidea rubescens DSM 1968]|uniref:N2227-domain-containing protein n=1 Tax=Ascoidea rubescens DSM 1968 TaxID=1344418 RepID=A0A1D2VMA6_9ASCO|nr:N2227-domain-containing protein [Ascoidea rubescens DSM 1968]ODV62743.1 N2227-domain-containing protein [Ascoidea rubescens DSM 1968]